MRKQNPFNLFIHSNVKRNTSYTSSSHPLDSSPPPTTTNKQKITIKLRPMNLLNNLFKLLTKKNVKITFEIQKQQPKMDENEN